MVQVVLFEPADAGRKRRRTVCDALAGRLNGTFGALTIEKSEVSGLSEMTLVTDNAAPPLLRSVKSLSTDIPTLEEPKFHWLAGLICKTPFAAVELIPFISTSNIPNRILCSCVTIS